MKHEVRLYNVLFPCWMLMLLPQVWLVVLPGNFLIDSLVFLACLHIFKLAEKRKRYWRSIFIIFGFGLLADLVGSLFLLVMMMGFELGRMGDELYLTLPALVIASVFIFLLNYCVTFRHYDKKLRLRFSLIFAVVTAPYTFLIPSSWLYSF